MSGSESSAKIASCGTIVYLSQNRLKEDNFAVLDLEKMKDFVLYVKLDWEDCVFLAIQQKTVTSYQSILTEDIEQELIYDEMMLVAQIVQAEAGNQDLDGMRLVADVVLNRMDSDKFPDSAYEVIFQEGQFGPTVDGAWEKAGWYICDNAFKAVEMEWTRESRLNSGILYFNTSWDNGTNPFKHGAHWFSY